MAEDTKVAAVESTASPTSAGSSGELKPTRPVTASKAVSNADRMAKVRAVKAAKALAAKASEAAKRAAIEAEDTIAAKMERDLQADKMSFGDIREVARVLPTHEEYVRVEIPLTDLFDHSHPGVQLNRHKFEPGKVYSLRGDVALEVKRRLAMFHNEQVRLLRPNADRKALADVNKGSQWTSRGSVHALSNLEDVPVASDEKVYTIDF